MANRLDPLAPPTPVPWAEGTIFFGALLVCRFGLLAILYHFLGGREIADDTRFQILFVQDPLQILLARPTTAPQAFPPLVPPLMWLLGYPLSQVLSWFVALRSTFIAYELMAWPVLWALICDRFPADNHRRLIAACYILAPITWMTSTVMSQEETISLLCLSVVFLLVLQQRMTLAIFVCGLGVVGAKIFFLVPLAGLILSQPIRPIGGLLRRACIGFAPVAAVYAVVTLSFRARGQLSPLVGFDPAIANSISIWALIGPWLDLSNAQAKHLSAPFALVGGLMPLALVKARGVCLAPLDVVRLVSAMLACVYLLFYHINPEYYLLLVPSVVLLFRPFAAGLILFGVMSISWAINFFYGVNRSMLLGDTGGKAVFVRLYRRITEANPATLRDLSIVAFAALNVVMVVLILRQIGQRQSRPGPVEPTQP